MLIGQGWSLRNLVLLGFFFFLLSIVLQNTFHFFDCMLVVVLENLLASQSNLLFEHLFVISQEELKPVALSVYLYFDVKRVVNCLILLFDEGHKVFGFVIKLKLIYKGLEELPYLGDEDDYDSNNNKVEKCELDDQKEEVYEQEENSELNQSQRVEHVEWTLSLPWLQVWLGFQFMDCLQIALV